MRAHVVADRDARRLLAGALDWLDLSPPPRWVGGVGIEPGKPTWRWCAERGSAIPD